MRYARDMLLRNVIRLRAWVDLYHITFGEAEIQNYVASVNTTVTAMKKYSWEILDNDYYRYVFDANMKPLALLQ